MNVLWMLLIRHFQLVEISHHHLLSSKIFTITTYTIKLINRTMFPSLGIIKVSSLIRETQSTNLHLVKDLFQIAYLAAFLAPIVEERLILSAERDLEE